MCGPKFLIWTICPKTKWRTSLGHMAPKKETECKRFCKLPKYGRSKVEHRPYLGFLDSEMTSRVAYALYLSGSQSWTPYALLCNLHGRVSAAIPSHRSLIFLDWLVNALVIAQHSSCANSFICRKCPHYCTSQNSNRTLAKQHYEELARMFHT